MRRLVSWYCMLHTAAFLWVALSAAEPSADFTVVIDAGHGGTNLGTPSLRQGVYEKHVSLDLARRVRKRLGTDQRVRVVLCREADVLLPIRARVRCANAARARLFISLHANASPEGASRGKQRGFEIYILPPGDVERDVGTMMLLEDDPALAAFAAQRVYATAAESLEAARRIRWRLADALGADRDRGIKQVDASLDVLQGLTMPGVLVEVGFLDHPDDAPRLLSDAGQEAIATALADAIVDLRARELRGRTDPWITARARVVH